MINRIRGILGALLVLVGGVVAAQTRPAGEPAAAAGPRPLGDLKISLMDGAVVVGKLSVPDLAIDTKYGSLKVPVDQILSFAPGLNSHPQFQQALNGYVNDLAADAFADREKAQAALQRLGPDIKNELERQLKTAEAEKQMRLQKIVEDFDQQMGEDESAKTHQWTQDDVIVTAGFTVVGRITTPSFSVTSPYGTLQLKMEDIREGSRGSPEPEEIRKSCSVNGAAITQHIFTNSGVRVNKGDKVEIIASGTIQMTPWGNQQATPDGGGNFGMMQPGNLPGGSLIGRIGDGGPLMKVGSKANFTADRAGVIMLGIATQGDYSSYQFPGEYQVKIRVVKK